MENFKSLYRFYEVTLDSKFTFENLRESITKTKYGKSSGQGIENFCGNEIIFPEHHFDKI